MTLPAVDVIVPVHLADRDVEAAVRSASTEQQGVETRAIVVLHDLKLSEDVRENLEAHCVIIECNDRLGSPSGPRNAGLHVATAPYVFFLDSDDQLMPHCLARMVQVADDLPADVVLPSLRLGDRYVGTPHALARRPRTLCTVRHDLFLRSHVPALYRRSMLEATGARFPDGIKTGEDFVFMASLVARVPTAMSFDAVYLIMDDAIARASTSERSPADDLAALRLVLESAWVTELGPAETRRLVYRMLAINLAGGWRRKRSLGQSPSTEVHALIRDQVRSMDRGAWRLLSVRDRTALRFDHEPGLLSRLLLSRPCALIPTSLVGMFSRHGPVPLEARSWIVRRRHRRAEYERP